MKDFYGNELVEGWYWYSSNEDGDIFYPIFVQNDKTAMLDGKSVLINHLNGLHLFRAEMPAGYL